MSQKRRAIMFVLSVLIFIVAGPTLILIASGYSVKEVVSLTKINFQRTGGVYIGDIGTDGKVFVDGKIAGGGSFFDRSLLVQSLSPKVHTVSIERDGFRKWEKKVTVVPNKVTEIHPVLIPTKVVFEKINDKILSATLSKELAVKNKSLIASTSGTVVLKSGNMFVGLLDGAIFFKWKSIEDTPQYMCSKTNCEMGGSVSVENPIKDIEWHPESKYGLVAISSEGFYVIEFDSRNSRNITKVLSPEDFKLAHFIKPSLITLDEYIYLSSGDVFYKINLKKAPVVSEKI